jgi:transglutaminase-like putative cysteine protease
MLWNHPSHLSGCVLSIADGVGGIRQTIRLMRALVMRYRLDPNIRARTITLLRLTPEKSALHEIETIFRFVRDSIRYVQDVVDTETVAAPDKVLALQAGDCDDKATLLATMLESVGYPTRFVVTGYSAPNVYEHVYVRVSLPDGSSLALDPSEPHAPGWEPDSPVAYFEET